MEPHAHLSRISPNAITGHLSDSRMLNGNVGIHRRLVFKTQFGTVRRDVNETAAIFPTFHLGHNDGFISDRDPQPTATLTLMIPINTFSASISGKNSIVS